jgi:voltage-gated potassium channel
MRINSHSASLSILRLPESSPWPSLLRRILVVVGVILLVAVMLYFTRGGLRDNIHPDREMTFVDVLYFTVISLTTVGYGDIVPVTPGARLINAILLTPVRILVLTAFIGTAYELILQRYREHAYMKRLHGRLDDHIIVCGFGTVGESIVKELMAHGEAAENIIVIEKDEEAAQRATAMGLTAMRGDASSEAILNAACLDRASHVMVAPSHDDECVLICLTVRTLNPHVRLVAGGREEENIKLLYRAGADVVVAPPVSGGRLMGAAARQSGVTHFLQDLLTFGSGLDASEYKIGPKDAGKTMAQVTQPALFRGKLVLGVTRGEERFDFSQLDNLVLQEGDAIVYIARADTQTDTPEK